MSIARRFLSALFGDEPGELERILIWTAPNKCSFYAANPEEAAKYAAGVGQAQNVYFGCGLSPWGLAHYERAKRNEIRGIPGIWADIDIMNPKAHNKTALPATVDEAINLAESLPVLPTLIVLSGHGIQPWWLFKEPWIFEGDDGGKMERARAADAVQGWQGLLRESAAARGYAHDATHDIARVMRLPGTWNIKDPDDIRPVEIINWHDGRRYNPEDFEGYLVFAGAVEETAAEVREPEFTARRGSGVPPHFVTLAEEDSRLANTWTRKRRDMKDSSHSGWDMALAGIMASYGDLFSDQDIADVIAAHRDRFCEDKSKEWKKGHDRQYIARTIAKARAQRAGEVREAALIESLDEGVPMEELEVDTETASELSGEPEDVETKVVKVRTANPELTHTDRAKKLSTLSGIFKVKIAAIRRYKSEPPQFELCLAGETVRVGDIGKLIGQNELRKVLASSAGVVFPLKKAAAWVKICQALLDCMEDIDVGEEGTEAGLCRSWLTQYLEENRPSPDVEGAVRYRRPFVIDRAGKKQTYIFLDGLREWLAARQERRTAAELSVMLKRYGCAPERFKVKLPDADGKAEKETTRSVFLLP